MDRAKLVACFDVSASLQDDKINFTPAEINDIDALPFVSRTGRNNGVTDYCLPRVGKVNPGGVITLALDGSTGATFYQHHPFLSGQNIWVLTPRAEFLDQLTITRALYLVASIRKAVVAYSYNLSLTKKRLGNVMLTLPMRGDGSLDTARVDAAMATMRHVDLVDETPEERYQILH